MAVNEWINGYLEAILDAGAKLREQTLPRLSSSSKPPFDDELDGEGKDKAAYSPTKYFVEEVVSRFDDTDLHKTWVKVVATRNSQERSNRLENLCWRIWHLSRKKKQIQWEDARQLAKRRLERERGSKEVAEDLSELSEGEKEKEKEKEKERENHNNNNNNNSSDSNVVNGSFARINSDTKIWSEGEEEEEEGKRKKLYVVLISLHGLVRGENMELGRDSDTGGQVKYVVELARALAATKGIYRVDLLTRQISSPDVDWTYGEPVEMLTRPSDFDPSRDGSGDDDGCGAYIIRLPCGPRDRYIPKESLWPYIPEFVDRALAHITNVARSLADQPTATDDGAAKPVWPYVIHGHYADAAEVAARLASTLNVPMVMTGHSLGRNKLDQLLKLGRLSRDDINSTYKIMRRIEAEETGVDAAEMVVTSTHQEIEEQWGLYDGFDLRLERKMRVRRRRGVSCLGRYMPRMVVIPPGMDFSYVNTQDLIEGDGDLQTLISSDRAQMTKRHLPPIWSEIMRFFTNPHKPMILALSRPDPKKNVWALLKAYGESRRLRELANLTLILGNRDDIEDMSGSSATVLTTVLKLIDRYDLYGQVAYPKHHKQLDVPHIYRLAAKTKGVFVNPALVEPFGLTLIEAAAYGLPVVATKNGGPVDIIKALNNGLLVDPHDPAAISDALLKLLADKSLWLDARRHGLRNIHRFSWPHHCRHYLSHVARHCRPPSSTLAFPPRLPPSDADDEPLSDSLRDLSIRLASTDGSDFKHTNGGADVTATILDALRRHRGHAVASNAAALRFSPGRRPRHLVIAADCYDGDGRLLIDDFKSIVEQVMGMGGPNGSTGYVLSSGSTISEVVDALRCCHVDPREFDALICSSGAEVCYPWRDLDADVAYGSHVEFRWPAEHVRSAVPRLAMLDGAEEDDLALDDVASSAHCYAYSVKPGAKVRKIDAIRQRLRMRGFRCNLVYTRACTRLNVVPLFASRPYALRYLSIQWGMDLSKVMVFVGEKGDTDHERLLPGLHKTVILQALVAHGSEKLLRDVDSYKMEEVVPLDAHNIFLLHKDCKVSDVLNAM
ncbi:probable sucrose-phosphate synthase 5 isoform X2 [Typha latifolia]|uniref:probable sucrose-phosphate synthase 5 isoform X2 n=1 Tax=Typha latifolia TaxID=4733 RepID=UPI003C301FCC